MITNRETTKYTTQKTIVCIAVSLLMTILVVLPAGVFAAEGTASAASPTEEEPVREVHQVGVGSKLYCFFATHNVVLTPAEIEAMDDETLTQEIISRSGIYMKETNCRKKDHPVITEEDWIKTGGSFSISEADIENLRSAEPVDGEPVKLHMDLRISPDPGDGDPQIYTTFKRTSPRILFAAVATETDAAYGEEICVEDKPEQQDNSGKKKKRKPKPVPVAEAEETAEEKEMLPEFRTISMTDRSGAPLEETLKDGKPVTLEWIEPEKHTEEDKSAMPYYIAGGIAAAAALAFIAVRAQRKNKSR